MTKVEFETSEQLHESGVRDRDGSIIGPRHYVLPQIPQKICGELGSEAISSGCKPGEEIKYRITIEQI